MYIYCENIYYIFNLLLDVGQADDMNKLKKVWRSRKIIVMRAFRRFWRCLILQMAFTSTFLIADQNKGIITIKDSINRFLFKG